VRAFTAAAGQAIFALAAKGSQCFGAFTSAIRRGISSLWKGWRYFARLLFVLALSFAVAPYLEPSLRVVEFRLLRPLLDRLQPRQVVPRFTKLVFIEDEEYYKGELEGRRPLKRDYLAKLIRALNAYDVRVIALDVDLRVPDPCSDNIPKNYAKETDDLIEAILDVAKYRPVVLAKTISRDDSNCPDGAHLYRGKWHLDPDSYDGYGLCENLDKNGHWAHRFKTPIKVGTQASNNISCGYIILSPNRRLVPGTMSVDGRGRVDSFALAIAKATNASLIAPDGTYYGSYIPQGVFEKQHNIFSAQQVLNARVERSQLLGEAVIVGGHWHTFASGRGDLTDLHDTPAGEKIVGALVHANFVEALLDGRTYHPTPEWVLPALAIFFVLAVILFWRASGTTAKVLLWVVVSLVFLSIQLASLYRFGTFVDGDVVLLGVTVHSVCELVIHQVLEVLYAAPI
jgi:CHASE2 domain-containing sensor protein